MRLSIKSGLVKNKLFQDSFWALLGSALGKALSLFAGILVARFLGKELYGQYGILKNTLLNIAVFSTLGLGYTGTRFIAKNINGDVSGIIRIIYRIALVSSFLMAILVFVFATRISIFIKAPSMEGALRLTAINIVINAINTSQIGILAGFKAFKQIAKNNVLAGIVTFILSGVFTYYWSFDGAIYALMVSLLFNVSINFLSVRRLNLINSSNKNAITNVSVKELLQFSIPIALQESMYTIVSFFSSYLLIKYANYGELGIASAASQWGAIVLFIPGVMKNVMLSYFSSSESTRTLRNKMILINGASTFIPWILIVLFSGFIVKFYGATFNSLRIVIIITCVSSIFSSISSVVVYEFISLGKNWEMFFLRLFRDGSSLLLKWFFLSSITTVQGSIISASVRSLCTFIFMVLLLLISKKIDVYKSSNAV